MMAFASFANRAATCCRLETNMGQIHQTKKDEHITAERSGYLMDIAWLLLI
jgi:hypothetical protein